MYRRAVQQQSSLQTPGNLVLVLPTAHFGTRSSCDFGWKLSAEHTFLSRSVLPLSLRTPLCQTDDLFVQSLQNVTLLLPPGASFSYNKLCLWSDCNWNRHVWEQERSLYVRGPAELLYTSESISSGSRDFTLQFHFRKCGFIQSWTYARHCNKPNTAAEALEWESYTSATNIWTAVIYSWKTEGEGKAQFQNTAISENFEHSRSVDKNLLPQCCKAPGC